jgi:hypothetical protein
MTKGHAMLLAAVLVVATAGCVGQGMSKESIIANPAEAMADCSHAPDDQKDNCYMFISDVLRTVNVTASYEACAEVSSPQNTQKNPRQDCIQGLIDAQNDTDTTLEICRLIDREDWKKPCLEELASSVEDQAKAIAICNEMMNDTKFREHCYGAIVAGASIISYDSQLSMCEAKSGTDRDNCLRGLAEQFLETNLTRTIELCNRISDSGFKNSCLNNFISSHELVKANTDLAVLTCGSFSTVSQSRCYSDIAHALAGTDPKKAAYVCQKLGDDILISDCYGNVWFYSNTLVIDNYDYTVSMCNVLTLKRDDCLNRIVSVLIDIDRAKAEATCLLMSAASSQNCVNGVHR